VQGLIVCTLTMTFASVNHSSQIEERDHSQQGQESPNGRSFHMMVLDDSIKGVNIVLTKSDSITFGTGLVACKIYPDAFGGVLGRAVWGRDEVAAPKSKISLGRYLERVASSDHSTMEAFRQFQRGPFETKIGTRYQDFQCDRVPRSKRPHAGMLRSL
jgi:hypothetical protein